MSELQVGELHIDIRPDGQLNSVSDWSIEVARALAEREQLTLTEAHIDIIDVMRSYYSKYNISPIKKLLKKEIAEKLDENKMDDNYLRSLFPGDVMYQGIRLAGLPTPMLDAELEPSNHIQEAKNPSSTSHFISEFDFSGKSYKVYPKGNLVNLSEWSEELALHMAKQEGIILKKDHWEVINYLRDFYFKYGITPMVKLLMKNMRQQLGKHKSSEAYLYDLFPGGPARQGSRIAGLPAPQGCIDP